jgi:hypothetical protein
VKNREHLIKVSFWLRTSWFHTHHLPTSVASQLDELKRFGGSGDDPSPWDYLMASSGCKSRYYWCFGNGTDTRTGMSFVLQERAHRNAFGSGHWYSASSYHSHIMSGQFLMDRCVVLGWELATRSCDGDRQTWPKERQVLSLLPARVWLKETLTWFQNSWVWWLGKWVTALARREKLMFSSR